MRARYFFSGLVVNFLAMTALAQPGLVITYDGASTDGSKSYPTTTTLYVLPDRSAVESTMNMDGRVTKQTMIMRNDKGLIWSLTTIGKTILAYEMTYEALGAIHRATYGSDGQAQFKKSDKTKEIAGLLSELWVSMQADSEVDTWIHTGGQSEIWKKFSANQRAATKKLYGKVIEVMPWNEGLITMQEIKKNGKVMMTRTLQKLTMQPIENKLFELPKGVKPSRISNQAAEEMFRMKAEDKVTPSINKPKKSALNDAARSMPSIKE